MSCFQRAAGTTFWVYTLFNASTFFSHPGVIFAYITQLIQ
jgi:hypothetical protein